MKKIDVAKVCNVISLLLFLGFIIHTVFDYTRYSNTLNSAPFHIWIIVNMIYFIIPAAIVFVVGVFIKHNAKTDK